MLDYLDFKSGDNITYLELLKPDGTSLGELKNAYKRKTTLGLGEVATLTFCLPNIENLFNIVSANDNILNGKDISNEDVGKTAISLVGYQLRAEYSNGLNIIYLMPQKTIESDKLTTETSFTCYSREHELSRLLILNYKGVLIDDEYVLDGLSLEEIVRDVLGTTYWTVDFLDEGYNETDQNVIRRSIEAYNNVSILSVIDTVCSIFGAIPVYDTINKKVSFYKADNYTYFKYNGLTIDGDNYLNKAKQDQKTEELVTKLYLLGKDDLTINGVNPTGNSYIEDLSYFIYPAQLNNDKTAITKHSKYMSDGLALAELLYEDKVTTSETTFETLYNQKDGYQQELVTLENQLAVLNTQLDVIQDEIDIYVGLNTANDNNAQYVSKRTEKDNKQTEIDNKQTEIDNKQNQIGGIDTQLETLYDTLKMENNFTSNQLIERQCFIYEGLYTNTGITIASDLYDEGCEYLTKKKEPSIVLDVGIESILSMKSKQAQKDANKIKLGEQIDVYYNCKGIDIDIRAQILGLVIDEEANSLELTIANIIDYKKSSADYLENILKRSITTSTTVETKEIDWNKGVIALDDINDLYTQGIDASKMQINAAVDNTVTTDARGITIYSKSMPLRFIRQTNGVIALTKDGGRTFSTAITPEGVFAERLIGQMLLGSQLKILSDDVNNSLQIADIPGGTYQDVNSDLEPYGDDFGLVVKGPDNLIFVSKERGFKITTPSGTTLFEAKTDGVLRAKGLQIISNDGYSILDGVNILQSWQDTVCDSCDASHPVYQYIYIPAETSSIRTAKLSLRRLNYRAYSKTTESAGATTSTTTSGGGGSATATGAGGTGYTAHPHNILAEQRGTACLYVDNSTTISGYPIVKMGYKSGSTLYSSSDFNLMYLDKRYPTNEWGITWYPFRSFNPTSAGSGSNIADINGKTDMTCASHTHPVSIPSHTHSISVNIPGHTHDLSYGILEQNFTGSVTVKVGNTTVGTYSADQSSINIKNYLTKGAWNVISYIPNGNARVQGTIFIQAMMGVPS